MGHAIDLWPEPGSPGRPPTMKPDQVEFALWCLVQTGGNVNKAARICREQHPDWKLSREMLRNWAIGRFKPRYDEMRRERTHELDQLVAARATDMAVRIVDVEEDALRRVHAGLADTDGVGASLILRNLSQSKSIQVEKSGQLRGNSMFGPTQVNLATIVGELQALGVSRPTEDRRHGAVDASAVEDGPRSHEETPTPAAPGPPSVQTDA